MNTDLQLIPRMGVTPDACQFADPDDSAMRCTRMSEHVVAVDVSHLVTEPGLRPWIRYDRWCTKHLPVA